MDNVDTEMFGLITEKKRGTDSVEQYLNLYKDSRGAWVIGVMRVAEVWQTKINEALNKEPIMSADFFYHLNQIARYQAYGPIEIERRTYRLVKLLKTPENEAEKLAAELYQYYASRDDPKAPIVRERYIDKPKKGAKSRKKENDLVPA